MFNHQPHRDKLYFLIAAGALSLSLLVLGGLQLLEFTDSTPFCGELCHTVMYPEYTTYQASPHSRVACSHCHVGPGTDYFVRSKVSGVPWIFVTISGDYHRPIPTPVENLRPARDTCEQCHRPERFAGDLVRVHTTFQSDEANTQRVDTRILRVGGGQAEVARDIHWHIAANVYYLPLDEKRQEIAWIGVEKSDGSLTEYTDTEKAGEVTPERINNERRLMDCVDCHNRATHIFRSPGELIDSSLLDGRIASLPFIKREALKALETVSPSLDSAYAKVEAIRDFYKNSYPDVYSQRGAEIDRSIEALKEVARLTTFPEMNVSWKTHIDNSAHQESPGCFRCHGKLTAVNGSQPGKVIDDSCDSCHYAVNVTTAPISNIPHPLEGFSDCLICHGEKGIKPFPSDHAGRSNTSCLLCHQPAPK